MTLQEQAAHPQLEQGRGLRILRLEMVQHTGEVEIYDFSTASTTILVGPRNSSKTTTLRVIDYCLGSRDSLSEALGSAIEDKYIAFQLNISIDGVPHTLVRQFDQGRRGVIRVDDELDLRPVDLSDWLLVQLGWPSLQIPLGRNPLTASKLVPLTFRSLLRHIYRREDSWTDFAIKEQEYLRRAVISLFLGFAPARYESADFELGQAQRRLAAADAVYRDVVDSTTATVRALVRQLGLPPVVDSDSLPLVRTELEGRLIATQSKRESLTASLESSTASEDTPGVDPSLSQRFASASEALLVEQERVADLRQVAEEQRSSLRMVEGEISRLHRLADSVNILSVLPVRICPVCEQGVDPARSHEAGTCYLCFQPVTEDVRRRRAEREERALTSELADLSEAVEVTDADLTRAIRHVESLEVERAVVARRLHNSRAQRLAPFVAALEELAADLARIEQQMAALPALEAILSRRAAAEQALNAAAAEVARLEQLAAADARLISDAPARCATLADRMNEFLQHFEDEWVEGSVTISAEDLTFYVGTRPWDQELGAEASVLFFLSYCYALLFLNADLGDSGCPPGLLLLDNPYQQGLPATTVRNAIGRISAAASAGGAQVIVTQARDFEARPGEAIRQIRMSHEYA